jgi:hypothetical protein
MMGVKKVMTNSFMLSLVGHTMFWPLFYAILVFGFEVDYWFYYLDLLWFLFAFAPISFHAGYFILWDPSNDRKSMEDKASSSGTILASSTNRMYGKFTLQILL